MVAYRRFPVYQAVHWGGAGSVLGFGAQALGDEGGDKLVDGNAFAFSGGGKASVETFRKAGEEFAGAHGWWGGDGLGGRRCVTVLNAGVHPVGKGGSALGDGVGFGFAVSHATGEVGKGDPPAIIFKDEGVGVVFKGWVFCVCAGHELFLGKTVDKSEEHGDVTFVDATMVGNRDTVEGGSTWEGKCFMRTAGTRTGADEAKHCRDAANILNSPIASGVVSHGDQKFFDLAHGFYGIADDTISRGRFCRDRQNGQDPGRNSCSQLVFCQIFFLN